jgi:hypothetical protein
VAVVGGASHAGPVTDPLSDELRDVVGDQEVGRRIPRALTPFTTPAYRWLAVSLTASSFAVAGTVPIVVAVVATFWARLPQDEIAHPLD